MLRTYPHDHPTVTRQFSSLYARLVDMIRPETPLHFSFGPDSVSIFGIPAKGIDVRRTEFLRPLLIDGVYRMSFYFGLTPKEVSSLLALWRATLDDADSIEESFTTRFWEASFEHISLLASEIFSPAEASPFAAAKRETSVPAQIAALVDLLTTESLPETDPAPPKSLKLTPEDLSILGMKELRAIAAEMEQQSLHYRDGSAYSIDESQLHALSREAAHPPTDLLARLFHLLLDNPGVISNPSQPHLREIAERLFSFLIAPVYLPFLVSVVRELLAYARSSPLRIEQRHQALSLLLSTLSSPECTQKLVQMLDNDELRADASALLLFFPREYAHRLLPHLLRPQTSSGRLALRDIITQLRPAPARFLEAVDGVSAEQALALFEVSILVGNDSHSALIPHLMQRNEPQIRRRLAEFFSSSPDDYREELKQMLMDADEQTRTTARQILSSHPAPDLISPLRTATDRCAHSAAELQSIVNLLAKIGGREASLALQHILRTTKSDAVRVSCIYAIGATGDIYSIPALRAVSRGWRTSRPIRVAANTALQQLQKLIR
ncbi:hypothetical protein D6833_12685 [Candidatus Parcubacteria bacterium]|nr:MAG: hypothetical protein D6833_12685 [Candidatus Parcubacteria bacterium]